MLNGILMPRFGRYMPWYLVSGILVLIGGSLMYTLIDVSTQNALIYGLSVLVGLGAGLIQNAGYSIASAVAGHERGSDAVGLINVAQIGGTVIALTITSAVFQNLGFRYVQTALVGTDFTVADIHAALAGAKSNVFTMASQEVKAQVIDGIVKAIGQGYILVIVAGAVILICSACMKREKLFMEVTAGG
jgi:MFS family permease